MYKEALEPVITHFTTDRYVPEFTKAKEIYFQQTGKVFEDEPVFEVRMTSFIEWYLFDRTLVDIGVPPIRLYYMIHREKMVEPQKNLIESMQKTQHSLFETVTNAGDHLRVRDVWTLQTYDVPQKSLYSAIQKGDLLDTRIFNLNHEPVLSDAMWLHPREVNKWILEVVEKIRPRGNEAFGQFLFEMAYKKLKRDRYKHLEAIDVYKGEG